MASNKPNLRMTAEEKLQADIIDLRCLDLCIATLENINNVCLKIIFLKITHLIRVLEFRREFYP